MKKRKGTKGKEHSDLQVTLVQTYLHWEDISANLHHFEKIIRPLKNSTDLIVLPEMFTTGFSMNAKQLAEKMDGKTIRWMKRMAQEVKAVIAGSIILQDKEKHYNRFIWMRPDGTHAHYDKRHLFGMGGEQKYYAAGKKRLLVSLNGWRICPQVCYDLRFPVWNRNRNDYDVLIFVANWPERRNFAWKHLLQARAIENQCYVIGVNRIGRDGHGVYHSGDSALIDPLGEVVFTQADIPFTSTFRLSRKRLDYVRSKLPFLKDADHFEIYT
ncbi:MAG TPA: amidohydrolase [Chitinophagales bacterium]|nr:amidohydrolase [Chitinophagales bacterium]